MKEFVQMTDRRITVSKVSLEYSIKVETAKAESYTNTTTTSLNEWSPM